MNQFMEAAIKSAAESIRKKEGGPFGACIIKNKKIIAVAGNTVLKCQDPTCHAEINAIRKAARKLKTWDLTGCEIFSTTEPCPMCFAAIHWSGLGRVTAGTTIRDAKALGFNELAVGNQTLKKLGKSKVRITSGFMRRECLELFSKWEKAGLPVY